MGRKPKSVVEKIGDAVDKMLHPEQADQAKADGLEDSPVNTPDKVEAAPVEDEKSTETETHSEADQMSEHPKFDKFKNTEGEHLDDK